MIPKSGKHTYGLDRFWNGCYSRIEKGLEISALAWLDLTSNCAYCLNVEPTPPTPKSSDPEATLMEIYLDQLSRVAKTHDLSFLLYVVTDGAYSKQKFVAGVRALGLHQIGKLRADANLRDLDQDPKRLGRGRQKAYDGKVNFDNLSRFQPMDTDDEDVVLDHQVLNPVRLKHNLQVVVIVNLKHKRGAVLFSTDVDLEPLKLYRHYKARFQIEIA